jgi:drug/metabolite transporter (DMT)-like permease
VLLGEQLTAAAIAGLALVVSGSWLAASQAPDRSARSASPSE